MNIKYYYQQMFKTSSTAAFFCLLVACAVFSSCGNDDDNNEINFANLQGTWKLVIEEGVEEGEKFYEDHSDTYHYLVFKGTKCIECYKDDETGKWEKYSNTSTYYLDEETETLTIGKDDYKILKLSSKELKLDDLSFKDYMEEGDWMHLTYRKVSNGDLREEE